MAFANLLKAVTGRNFGGTSANFIADPYLTGYHFTKWYMPGSQNVFDSVSGSFNSNIFTNKDDIPGVFDVCCLSVTIPGGRLNKTEIQGLGGTKWSVATNIDYDTSLTCKFLEFQQLPIFRAVHSWVKYIRDNKTGTTLGANEAATMKNNYSATVLYWTTKPDGKTVEFAACYSGVFPLKDPQELFQSDVASVEKVELDIEFNVDFVYQESWVYDKALELAGSYSTKLQDFRSNSASASDIPG